MSVSLFRVSLAIAALQLAGCHLRDRARAEADVEYHDNLQYSPHSGGVLDLYKPRAATEKVPAFIFIHGGYWRNQSRGYYQPFTGLYQNFGIALAKRGIATAVIDYRLFPHANLSDQLADVTAAAAFIREKAALYGIDPQQIFLGGHSAGGHLALMVLWGPNAATARGAVALSPILDIAHMRASKDQEFNASLTTPFFGKGETDRQQSPATHVRTGSPPALLLYGEKDDDFLLQQRQKYLAEFAANNLQQVKFATIPGADHTTMVMHVNTEKDNISDAIAAFIKSQSGEISHAK